jgi:hypothetical protein
MSLRLSLLAALLALVAAPLASVAEAGVGDNAGGVGGLMKRIAPVEQAQYFSFDDNNFCWYDGGWQGPGWYWCGDEWTDGVGWGGPYGWNGWRGGRFRRHHSHGGGVWHAGRPPAPAINGSGSVSGAAPHRFAIPRSGGLASPGFSSGNSPALHGGALASPTFNAGAAPAVHNFGGGGSFHSFGGGGGGNFHSFGGGGGGGNFHSSGGGGGGAFRSSGGGHR